jgi:hypothetical protein
VSPGGPLDVIVGVEHAAIAQAKATLKEAMVDRSVRMAHQS